MRLTEILKPVNIKIPLQSKTKTEAITELVDLLAANGEVTDARKVLESVLDREATRTTGCSGLSSSSFLLACARSRWRRCP